MSSESHILALGAPMEQACHKCRHDKRYCFWPSGSTRCWRCTDLKRRCSPSLRRPKLSERRLALHNRWHTDGTNSLMDLSSRDKHSSTSASAARSIQGQQKTEAGSDIALGSLPLHPSISREPQINQSPPQATLFDRDCACCVEPSWRPPTLPVQKEIRDKINKLYNDDWFEEFTLDRSFCADFNKYILPLEDLSAQATLVSIYDEELYLAMCCTLHAAFDLCNRFVEKIEREIYPYWCSSTVMACWLALRRIRGVVDTLQLWSFQVRLSMEDDKDSEEYFLSRQYGLPCEEEAGLVKERARNVMRRHYRHYF